MAKLYIKNTDGTFAPHSSIAVTKLDVVQSKGNSLTSAMSQKAVTDELGTIQDAIASIVNAGYVFAGVATPSTDPGTPEAKVFYIANGKGTYTNFGGLEVTEDEVVVLYWDTAWHKVATGIASQEKVSELDFQIGRKSHELSYDNTQLKDIDINNWFAGVLGTINTSQKSVIVPLSSEGTIELIGNPDNASYYCLLSAIPSSLANGAVVDTYSDGFTKALDVSPGQVTRISYTEESKILLLFYNATDATYCRLPSMVSISTRASGLNKEIDTKQNVLTDTDGSYGQRVAELDRQITGKAASLLSNIGNQRIPFDFVAGREYEFEIIATANSTIGFYDAQDTLLAVIARSPSVVSVVAPNGAVSIGAYFNAKTTINITDLSAIEPSVKQSREASADNRKGINLLNGWVDRGTLYNTLVPDYDRVCAIYPIDDVESTYKLELSKISLAGDYMFWKFSTDASVGTSAVGSVTYIYNALDETYDIALTDEQKARAKYLVVTFATNVQGAFFARLYKDNSALVKNYLELEKQEIGTARLLKAATFINANNAKRCFVLDGQISFNVGGETITLSGTIPYTWDRTTAMSWYAYVYDSHSKTFYFTSDILPYCNALFSFVAIGRSSQGDCRVYNFVFCPIAYKVDGVADFEIKSRTYNGEKIDLSSHRYDKTILFSNTDADLSHPSNVQGGAIYADRYLAQIVHETSATYLAIIDMDGVVKLGEFNIGLPEPCHGNCISFGKKQNANDVFPLLYISQGDATNNSWKCFVVKIADNATSCSLVSTISYNGSRYENTRQIDWCVDIEHNSLWSYSKTQENNTTEFCRYDLPLITNSDVILSDADIKESFIVDKYINQQVCFLGNKILCCSGVLNSFAPPFIYAIDIERQKVVTSIDVDWIGEPQNCFRFKETLVVGTSGTNYYTLSV